MTRMLLVSVALLGLIIFLMYRLQDIYTAAQPPIVTRVDIYGDRVTYRTGVYTSTSALAIGLKAGAHNDPPRVIELHDCGRKDDLATVLDLLREEGVYRYDIVLPDDC